MFHGFVPGIVAGTRYGLRADGPWDPHAGHRFNPAKLLVDPYARALDRPFVYDPALTGTAADPRARDPRDTAALVPKGIAAPTAVGATSKRSRVPWQDTLCYELHVRGFTRTHPGVPEAIRGTCAGLAHAAAIDHLLTLGVTTVELMPIAAMIDERHLWQRALTNYWGYNPVAWFVPDPRLAPGGIDELRLTVDALHAAGLEVVLDVVLNHSGEGDAAGPTISLRGLDNAVYYRTVAGDAARYVDDTGCGNALALERAPVLRLALDVLRYYALAAGVDGFRFDLATSLARRSGVFDPYATFLQAVAQDPALRQLKLIVEPWDLGPGGYRLGAFPPLWGEWNDRYRDDVRRFWRGDAEFAGRLATRLAGSADVFRSSRRLPSRSINFVTAHDGFTLADLVAHAVKHNEANGEANRDGADANWSWNHGTEGATQDPAVAAARARDVRSLLATLFVSRGTPMLAMGDELGRTQRGNNNAYAHDNALTWIDWPSADTELTAFVGRLAALRRSHPALRQDRWLEGVPQDGTGIPDVEWRRPDGRTMSAEDWARADHRGLVAALYAPATADGPADRVVVALNAGSASIAVRWPVPRRGYAWQRAIDTALPNVTASTEEAGDRVDARAVVVLVEAPSTVARAHGGGIDDATVDRVALAAGIEPTWWDIAGERHDVAPDTKRALLTAMGLRLESADDADEHLRTLEAIRDGQGTPQALRAYLPDSLRTDARRFGLAAQLYALRRAGDQGIGDFSTLAVAATATARAGGAFVGIHPLHALFAAERERASPYHPSDRRFLDPIYIDVEQLSDLAHSRQAQSVFGAKRPCSQTWPRAPRSTTRGLAGEAGGARGVLRGLRAAAGPRSARAGVRALRRRGGRRPRALRLVRIDCRRAPGCALATMAGRAPRPDGSDVRAFARRHARAIRFACYLQWQADRQLEAAAHAGREAGLDLGLYRDLAVGAAPDGAETWSQPDRFARGASIGAPPDPFASGGQNWNLPPPIPHSIAADGASAFRTLLAANMRHAGALRIDHVMGLSRLFWIPDGAAAREGAYVHYPFATLLAVVAEESMRARCLVVGEDLGTVPAGLRERLAEADILSYRVLWFERDDQGFVDPARYPEKAAACVTTHDLPTIAGWWTGADIAERHALGLAGGRTRPKRCGSAARRALIALAVNRVATASTPPIDPEGPCDAAVIASIHAFVGATRSALVLFRAEDLASEVIATNLPGTDRERPNWRRRLAIAAADLWSTPAATLTLAAGAKRRRPAGTSG